MNPLDALRIEQVAPSWSLPPSYTPEVRDEVAERRRVLIAEEDRWRAEQTAKRKAGATS